MDPVGLLEELVAVPSLTGDEAALAELICDRAAAAGLAPEMVGRNVVIRIGPPSRSALRRDPPARLLLNSHLDTVPPNADWKTDPFQPVRHGQRIHGLGANDAKGCVAAMIAAVAGLDRERLGGEVVLALTVEEETAGGDGLEALVPWLGSLDGAVIGEPTGLDICRCQKGLMVLEVELDGTARHAAHAHRLPGKNAVEEAARSITALAGWRPAGEHPLLGPVTCEVTTISGGSRRNVIPDRCSFHLDVRTVAGVSTEHVVRAVAARTGGRVRVVSDRLKPMETPASCDLVRSAERARPGARIIGSATMSDAVWTRHLPTIKVGPGETERSHTAGEYVTSAELEAGAAFYSGLASDFLGAVTEIPGTRPAPAASAGRAT